MKKSLIIFVFLLFNINLSAQRHTSKCRLTVMDVSKIVSLGYLIGYNLEVKNTSNKSIDGVYWTEVFYNNAGDLIQQSKASFNSTNLIDPILSGVTKHINRPSLVKGASKVVIQIDKVHFTDGTTCK